MEISTSAFVKRVLEAQSVSEQEFKTYEQAFENAESFGSLDSEVKTAVQVGMLAYSCSKFEMALWVFEGGIMLATNEPELWVGLALALLKQNSTSLDQIKACRVCLKNALKIKPDYMEALEFLDDISDPDDELQSIIERTISIIESHPEYADQHHLLGVCLIEQGRYIEALHEFNAALAINCNLIRTILQRALLLVLMERFEEAMVDFRLLLETVDTNGSFLSFPSSATGVDYEQIIASIRAFESSGDFAAACELYSDLFHISPNLASNLLAHAKLFYGAGLYDLARRDAFAATELAPTYADGHWLIGMLDINAGESDKALVSLAQALELNPFYADAASVAVPLWLDKGEVDRVNSLRKKWEVNGEKLPSWFYR